MMAWLLCLDWEDTRGVRGAWGCRGAKGGESISESYGEFSVLTSP